MNLVKYSKRNSTIELLRMFFMLGIVFLHAFYHGSNGNIEWIYSLGKDNSTAYQLSLYSLSRIGVTGFMFISGYYGIKMNAQRIYKFLSMVIFYFIVVAVLCSQGFGGIIKGVIHAWDAWWFVASYFMICILSPILNAGLDRLSQRDFLYVVLGILTYTYLGHFIVGLDSHDTELLLSIYIIARYVRKRFTPPISKRKLLCVSALSILILCFAPIIIMKCWGNIHIVDILICNNSPLVLLTSSSLVLLLDSISFHSRLINWMASSTFAVYLLTDNGLRSKIDSWILNNILDVDIYGYLLMLLVFIVCIIIDKMRGVIFLPIDKKINKWILKRFYR